MDELIIDHRHCMRCNRVIYKSIYGDNMEKYCELCLRASKIEGYVVLPDTQNKLYCDVTRTICTGTSSIGKVSNVCNTLCFVSCTQPIEARVTNEQVDVSKLLGSMDATVWAREFNKIIKQSRY